MEAVKVVEGVEKRRTKWWSEHYMVVDGGVAVDCGAVVVVEGRYGGWMMWWLE